MREFVHSMLRYYLRNFPVSRGKARILSMFWKPLSFGKYQRRTALRQANIQMNCDLTKFLQRRLYFMGSYEDVNCAYWMKLASNSRIIMDIGANVGLYSLLAAAANPYSEIHAFEPTLEVADILTDNIRLNRIENILVNSVAMGEFSGHGFLHVCTGDSGNNEGMNFVTNARVAETDISAQIVSLEDYCHEKQIDYIDLMKIDIEGGEYKALLGARSLLKRQAIGCIFLELAEWAAKRSGHSTIEVKQFLLEHGYQIYQKRSRNLIPVPLEMIHDGDDVIAFARQPEFPHGLTVKRPKNSWSISRH